MPKTALALANDAFQEFIAKTSHGLVRGPCRFDLVGVIDPRCAGKDAGEVLDGVHRGIPIFASVDQALQALETVPDYCIVGVATPGGVLPDSLRQSLVESLRAGMSALNGLHTLLSDQADLRAAAEAGGATITDFRQPRPVSELHHWSGKILDLTIPRIAVLGTDCCIGKRTSCGLLRAELEARGLRASMVYTGQTGWLQGYAHGFFFDATPNDFVCGELERVVLECAANEKPDVILLEGQSSFHNPAGPCGAEFLLSAAAQHVVLQHAPGREYFDDIERPECRIPSAQQTAKVVEALGRQMIAVTLNHENRTTDALRKDAAQIEADLGIPAVLPLEDGMGLVADAVIKAAELKRR